MLKPKKSTCGGLFEINDHKLQAIFIKIPKVFWRCTAPNFKFNFRSLSPEMATKGLIEYIIVGRMLGLGSL